MGREQELLEAARSGNVSAIEKILSPRKRMTVGNLPLSLGPFQSLRRAPNPNCHDQNGDTPLHLAALNGHINVVKFLLSHEASTNIMDLKGCYPLHLAAWSGNAEMCRVLLTHGPSTAMVNEQNQVGETAVHCAAQYGHRAVVEVLLQNRADPSIRNNRTESALDLAAQYGRLETVELLVRKHPALLADDTGDQSPLHLAAKNGHRHVVQTLLDAGFDLNKTTESGTALHEAAIFGKLDVVRLLLKQGIDVRLTDSVGRTTLDILSEAKSQLSLDIGQIILDYQEGHTISDKRSSNHSTSDLLLEEPLYDNPLTPRRCYIESDSEQHTPSVRNSADSSVFGATGGGARSSVGSENYFLYDAPRSRPIPIGLEEADSLSDTSETAHSLPGVTTLSYSPGTQCSLGAVASRNSQGTSLPVTPETPKKPPRRKPPGSVKSRVSRLSPPRMVFINKRSSTTSQDSVPDNDKMKETNGNTSGNNNISETDQRDLCDNVVNINESQARTVTVRQSSDLTNLNIENQSNNATNSPTLRDEQESALENNNVSKLETLPDRTSVDNGEYLQGVRESTTTIVYRSSVNLQTNDGIIRISPPGNATSDDEMATKETRSALTTPSSRPPSLDFSSKRSSAEIPLSPTGYQQPPTPDHPPPSPMTALLGIHEKINPKDKRKSRDMETITETELLAAGEGATSSTPFDNSQDGSTAASAESHSPGGASILRQKHRPGSDMFLAAIGDNPFLGLTKGAIPKGERRVKSQIFESFQHVPRSRKRVSAPGLYMTFDPLMEGDESPAVMRGTAPVMRASPASIRMSVRQSMIDAETGDGPLDENEEWAKIAAILSSCGGRMTTDFGEYDDFERRLQKILVDEKRGAILQSVGDWLEELGLPQYENIFVANGFDDIDFIGPNILEEQDLLELGIMDESHRKSLLKASRLLPPLKPIVECPTPASVEQWLHSLHLSDYIETFQLHNFTSMDRIRNIWELELNSVLDITSLGHRKRILASLRVPTDVDSVSQGEDFLDFTKNLQDMNEAPPDELSNLNLFKDYTNVRPRTRVHDDRENAEDSSEHTDCSECELCQQQLNGASLDESSVQIRPPNTSSMDNINIKQWRHQPEVLIKGCCNYTVQYLGSTLVKSLQGTESTRESIHRMKRPHIERVHNSNKKSSESIAKVPSVVLSISYRGVKFIDARSKHVICEHDISNIFCACQDGENLNYFAYITRDHVTERHYCHVFCVYNTELATEIILTLGEAFEVAYQVAIRERVIDEEESNHHSDTYSEETAEAPSESQDARQDAIKVTPGATVTQS